MVRSHYSRHRDYYLAKAARRNTAVRTEARRRIYEYLLEHPCVDCGEADPIVLQFDHVRGEKLVAVSDMVQRHGGSWVAILAEIAKCEVRCANCHLRATARRRGYDSRAPS